MCNFPLSYLSVNVVSVYLRCGHTRCTVPALFRVCGIHAWHSTGPQAAFRVVACPSICVCIAVLRTDLFVCFVEGSVHHPASRIPRDRSRSTSANSSNCHPHVPTPTPHLHVALQTLQHTRQAVELLRGRGGGRAGAFTRRMANVLLEHLVPWSSSDWVAGVCHESVSRVDSSRATCSNPCGP